MNGSVGVDVNGSSRVACPLGWDSWGLAEAWRLARGRGRCSLLARRGRVDATPWSDIYSCTRGLVAHHKPISEGPGRHQVPGFPRECHRRYNAGQPGTGLSISGNHAPWSRNCIRCERERFHRYTGPETGEGAIAKLLRLVPWTLERPYNRPNSPTSSTMPRQQQTPYALLVFYICLTLFPLRVRTCRIDTGTPGW